jgi:prepilin-type N-terminal cleavage/methylation domain-containing protein
MARKVGRAWLPMWCCRTVRIASAGFTLIEMLVVMVLLGMIAGLALPAMQRWHDAVQSKAKAASLVDSVRAASFAAGAQRRVLRLSGESFDRTEASAGEPRLRVDGDLLRLHLPAGWTLRRSGDIAFLASGLCQAGEAVFDTDRGIALVLRIGGPVCTIALDVYGGTDGAR